jgi:exopolysaccharide biosynthesis polyprenyl glycosylphosphotransferase
MALSWFIALVSIFACRELWKSIARALYDRLGGQDNIILIADGKVAETVSKLISRDPHNNLILAKPDSIDAVKTQMASGMSVQEVIVQGQSLSSKMIEDFLEDCEDRGIEIKILPDFLEMRLGEILVDDSLGIPVLHLKPLSLQGFRYYFKRIFDISLAILILSVFSVPLLIISLCIAIDSPGGVFFLQDRMGFKDKIFKCLKFRTMHKNAEALLKDMNLTSFRGGPAFKMKGDPRITRVGKWIRKFSLDELPQIWNILRGEMSFIGPRPQVMKEANGNPEWAKKRYRILPGITGLWQVSGRADLSYEDMMRLDIYYLENWSPGLDLRILLKTVPVVLGAKGAY